MKCAQNWYPTCKPVKVDYLPRLQNNAHQHPPCAHVLATHNLSNAAPIGYNKYNFKHKFAHTVCPLKGIIFTILQNEVLVSASFFSQSLSQSDSAIAYAIANERTRQQQQIELIASENIVSQAVLDAQGSVLTNKYAEGYPNKRYYGGCAHVDVVEALAIERACELFQCSYANVQPHSGAQANGAVMLALLQPSDTILGMSLSDGGHLTHGAKPALSGKWFNAVHYGVREDTMQVDYDQVRDLAKTHKPKLIIAGTSAYSQILDWSIFRSIADEVGAYLLVDMAHIAGLVAGGAHPSPLPHAHITTSTTHKTLRGPRGGLILSNDQELGKTLNSAVFPGLQGGPLMHVIAAKAVSFGEALQPEFRTYATQVVANAQALGDVLKERGCDIVSGSTKTHLVLLDLRPKGMTGDVVEDTLEEAAITCNKNAIPFDSEKPTITSGVRLGAAAATTRGFTETEFKQTGHWIIDIVDALASGKQDTLAQEITKVRTEVHALCARFPIYQ